MKTYALKLALVAALSCATVAALAENPFAGTWKIDDSKSNMTGQTFTFAPEAGGAVRSTSGSISYVFKTDGSSVTDPWGVTEQWTKVDDRTWKAVERKGTTVLERDTYTLSSDGNTLEALASGTKPNGEAYSETASLRRVGSGHGFFGTWKSTKVSDNSLDTLEIAADGDNGIVVTIPEEKATASMKFDGKEVAATGPLVPDGSAWAATRTGPRSFSLTAKMKGKAVWKGEYTVSPDGKTMTVVGGDPAVNEPITMVFRKQ